MIDIQYYIIDTETTGFSEKLHEINEFSIIRCKDKVNLFKKVKCDHPESASLDALRITRKTMEDLNFGISKSEACDIINRFLEMDNTNANARCIVGHNVSFDRKFLFSMYEECGKIFPANLWMDTVALTRFMYKKANIPSKGKLKLADACDFMKVKKINDAHQAKVDSKNTYLLWKNLMDSNINYIDFIKNVKQKSDEQYDFDISDTE